MGRHGENIRKRKDGRWEARVIDSYSPDGKAHYRYLYGKTYYEVKNKKNKLLATLKVSPTAIPAHKNELRITFGQLMDEWFHSRKGSIKESTFANYANVIEKHLSPGLGSLYLSSITTDVLDTFLKTKLTAGRLDGKGGLAPKTVADLRSVLLMIIEYARSHNYLCPVNCKVFYPKHTQPDARVLTRHEQAILEEMVFTSQGYMELGILIALYGGLRIGEVCALQWRDIQFSDGTVNITKTVFRIQDLTPNAPRKTKVVIARPKTASSSRIVPLPSFILQRLRTYRSKSEDYILTGTSSVMEPRNCLKKYQKLLKQIGLPGYTFHTLRHTFATRCVESNFDPKSLSEILGHSNVTTTLQRYVHPSMELKKLQMERLEKLSFYGQNHGQ